MTVVNILLSALVFAVFWSMVFYKLVIRHTDRIQNYEDELQFFWHFFDKKSFLIMAFMMTFGIGLRASHFAPDCVHRCVLFRIGNGTVSGRSSVWSSLFSAGKKSKQIEKVQVSVCLRFYVN